MPNARRHPRAAAKASRAFLMLRLGRQLGLREKNLGELLVCPRGRAPTTEQHLELASAANRWSDHDDGWEVLIPVSAFKNANSSFFDSKRFRLVLPDLGDNAHINAYVETHRAILLGGARDPETFFENK